MFSGVHAYNMFDQSIAAGELHACIIIRHCLGARFLQSHDLEDRTTMGSMWNDPGPVK